jgi:hypothetical protein
VYVWPSIVRLFDGLRNDRLPFGPKDSVPPVPPLFVTRETGAEPATDTALSNVTDSYALSVSEFALAHENPAECECP